jgi:hypothetical protein
VDSHSYYTILNIYVNLKTYMTFLTGDLIGALGYGLTSFFGGAGFSSLFNNKFLIHLYFFGGGLTSGAGFFGFSA